MREEKKKRKGKKGKGERWSGFDIFFTRKKFFELSDRIVIKWSLSFEKKWQRHNSVGIA